MYLYEPVQKSKLYPKGIKASAIRLSQLTEPQNGVCHMLRLEPEGHMLYITDLFMALGYHTCPVCHWGCDHRRHFRRHVNRCARKAQREMNGPVKKFKEGLYVMPEKSLFDQIEYVCQVKLEREERTNFYLSFFDCETFFVQQEPEQAGPRTKTLAKLQLMVLGLSTNLPKQKTQLFWKDEGHVGERFVESLARLSKVQEQLLIRQYARVFQILEMKQLQARIAYRDDTVKLVGKLIKRLEAYTKRLVCLGFSSGKFDCFVLREELVPALINFYGGKLSKVKATFKNSRYMKIVCEHVKILDTLNYMPAKCRYDDFLYQILGERGKSMMPYDYCKTWAHLDGPLPDYEHWYSELKMVNLLDETWLAYQDKLAKGCSSDKAVADLGLKAVPKHGEDLLEELRQEYKQRKCTSLRQWVAFYLRKDLEPGVRACEKLARLFYDAFGKQLFTYASIPAVSLAIAFETYLQPAGVDVYVPSQPTYELLLSKTAAGQSILFNLYQRRDESKIKEREFGQESLTCKSVCSLDANLLYGYSAMTLPYGYEILRKRENQFRPEFALARFKYQYKAEMILAFMQQKYKLRNFETDLKGSERLCRYTKNPFKPDGVGDFHDEATGQFQYKMIIEVLGHAHSCIICDRNKTKEPHRLRKHKDGRPMTHEEVRRHDARRLEQMRKFEFNKEDVIVEIHICQFKRDYTQPWSPYYNEYRQFLYKCPQYGLKWDEAKTEAQLLDDIYNERLKGFLVADFNAGPELRKLTDDYPLIFKKTLVKPEDCGPIMSSYLRANKLMPDGRMELISSHFAKQHIVSSELAILYMEMGMEITNVSQFIQYNVTDALGPMVNRACELRYRAAAMGPDERTVGNLQKALTGVLVIFYQVFLYTIYYCF